MFISSTNPEKSASKSASRSRQGLGKNSNKNSPVLLWLDFYSDLLIKSMHLPPRRSYQQLQTVGNVGKRQLPFQGAAKEAAKEAEILKKLENLKLQDQPRHQPQDCRKTGRERLPTTSPTLKLLELLS